MQSNNPLIYLLLSAIVALAGLAVTAIVAIRPKRVWSLLIAGSIITSGMMPRGYTLVDELSTAFLILGAFLMIAITSETRVRMDADRIARLHQFFFSLMIAYMIFQSARGLVELEDLRKIRWVAFYGVIGLLTIVLRIRGFTLPSRRQVIWTVTLSTLVYVTVYTLHGLMAELFGASRWDLQLVWWGTPAYTLLPVAVAMPAVIFCLKDRDQRHRNTGWITLVVTIIAALYYDSRVALLSILMLLIVALPRLGIKRFAVGLLWFVVVLSVFLSLIWPSYRDLRFFAEDLFGSASALWRRQEDVSRARDIDRYAHMQVAFPSIADNWKTLLFGHGYRAHGRVISPHLRALYEEYGRADLAAGVQDDQSTEGFTALLVDTGIVGLLLLIANFLVVAWQVLHEKTNRYRLVILSSLIMLFLWLFVINILDITLFYLAIMPSGLLLLMARSSDEQAKPKLSSG